VVKQRPKKGARGPRWSFPDATGHCAAEQNQAAKEDRTGLGQVDETTSPGPLRCFVIHGWDQGGEEGDQIAAGLAPLGDAITQKGGVIGGLDVIGDRASGGDRSSVNGSRDDLGDHLGGKGAISRSTPASVELSL